MIAPGAIPAAINSEALIIYWVFTPPQPPDRKEIPTLDEVRAPSPIDWDPK